ncbi:hypothetical protein [Enterovibrio sp. 27052020O]|uniref:hypothetical protein n=1 Tax=Enterovibrio sp. 27052020O TaxID=3241166 RepID=UPI00388F3BA1
MNRFTDINININISAPLLLATIPNKIPLPVIDWQAIRQAAPKPLVIEAGQFPQADMIVVTWTSAEWSALDHVMLNSAERRFPDDTQWRSHWFGYTDSHDITAYTDSPDMEPLFYFQLVGIDNGEGHQQRVLLVKSQAHLAHPPWITGLEAVIDILLEKSGAKKILSTGTAGGGSITDMLGAAIVTNSGHIQLEKPENSGCDYNHQTFTCKTWFPSEGLYKATRDSLMFAMDQVWNADTIADAIVALNQSPLTDPPIEPCDDATTYTYDDLINPPLNPDNLKQAQVKVCKNQPLLTTDYYFIEGEEPHDPYCFLEMDDAVIAHQAERAGVEYAFIRNVSDPIVVTHTASGHPIPESVRGNWSGIIYQRCGFYSSFNSVLLTWAAIAGE